MQRRPELVVKEATKRKLVDEAALPRRAAFGRLSRDAAGRSDSDAESGAASRSIGNAAGVCLLATTLIATLMAPDYCADYPDGRRCDAAGYTLMGTAILAVALVLLLGFGVIVGRRRRRSRTGRSLGQAI